MGYIIQQKVGTQWVGFPTREFRTLKGAKISMGRLKKQWKNPFRIKKV